MSWKQYVERHLQGHSQVWMADLVGVSQTAVSRWRKGDQNPDAGMAIQVARAVGDDPLVALIEAGYLTPAEAKSRPATAPDYSQLSNDDLLDLVRDRMREQEVTGNAEHPAPMNGTTPEDGAQGRTGGDGGEEAAAARAQAAADSRTVPARGAHAPGRSSGGGRGARGTRSHGKGHGKA